jgi:nicotinamide riboside kinase
MMKRIIITGASGVGKTTIVETLTSLLSLPMIPELGREICHHMGYQNPTEIPDQNLFKQSVLTAQIEREEELQSFISDRSAIDCWVLWQRWNMCAAMSYDTEAYYETARAQAMKYTHIIYIPPMFPPADDGFRWTDPDYQKQVDRITRMTLFDFCLWDRTFTVTKLGKKDRIREVQEWLSKTTARTAP